MGMYDSVYFTCPDCGGTVEAQSKVGDCRLYQFGSNSVPPDIAVDIDGTTVWCDKCNQSYTVRADIRINAIPMHLERYPIKDGTVASVVEP